jgi:hypothetical protein
MQHEHGWEPERRQKQGRRHSLRRLLAGRLRPLWLPHRPIRSRSQAPRGEVRGVRMCAADPPLRGGCGLAGWPMDSHARPWQLDAWQRPRIVPSSMILGHGFGGQGLALSSPDSMAGAGSCQIAIAVFMRRKPSLP